MITWHHVLIWRGDLSATSISKREFVRTWVGWKSCFGKARADHTVGVHSILETVPRAFGKNGITGEMQNYCQGLYTHYTEAR